MPYKDPEKQRAYQKKYYAAHPEKCNDHVHLGSRGGSRNYYAENLDKLRARNKKYYDAHREN